jgi:hypothetical protein
MVTPSYPFPPRNPQHPRDEAIVWPHVEGVSYAQVYKHDPATHRALFDRAHGDEARLIRLQYLGIEEELELAFRYVIPAADNAGTYSFKFAEIIRAAANAYEILCKSLYARFYNDQDELNIFNYLALDRFLRLARQRVAHVVAIGSFASLPEVSQPFIKLASWDQNSVVNQIHIPDWWTAYNKVKHTNQGLQRHATLANATAVVAALFLVIEAVYGRGVLSGGFWDIPRDKPRNVAITMMTRWTRLFAWLYDEHP